MYVYNRNQCTQIISFYLKIEDTMRQKVHKVLLKSKTLITNDREWIENNLSLDGFVCIITDL